MTERYDMDGDWMSYSCDEGDWVKAEDYLKLQAVNEELKRVFKSFLFDTATDAIDVARSVLNDEIIDPDELEEQRLKFERHKKETT